HPGRGGPPLPRRRDQPATGELGRDARRGDADLLHRLVVLPLPGARAPAHGARLQPARRRDPRRPRPESRMTNQRFEGGAMSALTTGPGRRPLAVIAALLTVI